MAIKNALLGGTDNINGDIIDAGDVNDTNNAIIVSGAYGNAPVGSILPWLKSYPNTPALPDGWVECSGQVLNDAGSVYDGQTIPNLNGNNYFLRGNSTSGTTGGADSYSHNHQWAKVDAWGSGNPPSPILRPFSSTYSNTDATYNVSGSLTSFSSGNSYGSDNEYAMSMDAYTSNASVSSLPPYYEVVWIMRVK